MGGAALGHLAREQITEAADTAYDKASAMIESDAGNTVDAEAVPAEDEAADTAENVAAG